jgi:hypothetical protein
MPTEHCTWFECGWNLGWWCLNAFYQTHCRGWDSTYTQNIRIHMHDVWKFFCALLRINFIFKHRCVNCICWNVLCQTNLFPSPQLTLLHSLSLCVLCFAYTFVNTVSRRYVLCTGQIICCSTAMVFGVSEINVVYLHTHTRTRTHTHAHIYIHTYIYMVKNLKVTYSISVINQPFTRSYGSVWAKLHSFVTVIKSIFCWPV